MIKKLDILIIRSFIGPFIVTFFVSLFVLVMQFFWLYMDEMIGKGLSIWMLLQLLIYMSATLVPLALVLIPGVGAVRTNTRGEYLFTGVPAGAHSVTVRSSQGTTTVQVSVGAGATPTVSNVNYTAGGATPNSVTVTVQPPPNAPPTP